MLRSAGSEEPSARGERPSRDPGTRSDSGRSSGEFRGQGFGRGPFGARDPFPLARVHLSLAPQTPVTLEKGESRLGTVFEWVSTFAKDGDDFLFDSESRLGEISFAHGVTDALEVGARVGYLWRGDGILDSVVDRFHRALALPDGGREEEPRNEFRLTGFAKDTLFPELDPGGSVTDVILHGKYRVFGPPEGRFSAAVEGQVTVPVARDGFGADSVDGGIQLLGGWDRGRINFFGGAGWTVFGDSSVAGFRYTKHRLLGFVTVEWEISPRVSTLLQVQGANRLIRNVEGFPSVASYLLLGVKWEVRPGLEFESAILENLRDQDGTADFGARFGLSFSF